MEKVVLNQSGASSGASATTGTERAVEVEGTARETLMLVFRHFVVRPSFASGSVSPVDIVWPLLFLFLLPVLGVPIAPISDVAARAMLRVERPTLLCGVG